MLPGTKPYLSVFYEVESKDRSRLQCHPDQILRGANWECGFTKKSVIWYNASLKVFYQVQSLEKTCFTKNFTCFEEGCVDILTARSQVPHHKK